MVNQPQLACVLRVWQLRSNRELTDHDCRQIERNIYGFLGVLAEWAKADQQNAETDQGEPAATNHKSKQHKDINQ